MALDPQCRAMLDAIAENGSPFDHEDPAMAREIMAATTRPVPYPDERFADVHDGHLNGPEGNITFRYYRPNDTPGGPRAMHHLLSRWRHGVRDY